MTINDKNYYTIFYWMISELKLKGAQLPIFAIIYSFSQDGINCFSGSLRYLAEFAGVSKQTAINVLKKLIEKNYVVKFENIENGIKYIRYSVNLQVVKKFDREVKKFDEGGQKILMGWSKNFNGGGQISLPNNKEYNKDDNKEIYNHILDSFNSICSDLPSVKIMSDTRRSRIKSFLKTISKYDLNVDDFFTKAQSSDYLTGRNGVWTGCSFDWLTKQSNTIKVCEGNYDNRPNKSSTVRY